MSAKPYVSFDRNPLDRRETLRFSLMLLANTLSWLNLPCAGQERI
jgi:hypothetical protein